jgi:hypothetical protein
LLIVDRKDSWQFEFCTSIKREFLPAVWLPVLATMAT